jgi:hypothetical protein
MSSRNVRLCGIGFTLIFTAYNTAQNYMTTLLGPKFGSWSLTCVYSGCFLATPFAAAAVRDANARMKAVPEDRL